MALIARDKILNDEAITLPKDALRLFSSSNKWVGDFISRHGAVSKMLHGEAATKVDLVQEERDMEKIRAKLEDVDPRLIYNVDETGLFYRCLPKRSYIFKEEGAMKDARGSKVHVSGTKSLFIYDNLYPFNYG